MFLLSSNLDYRCTSRCIKKQCKYLPFLTKTSFFHLKISGLCFNKTNFIKPVIIFKFNINKMFQKVKLVLKKATMFRVFNVRQVFEMKCLACLYLLSKFWLIFYIWDSLTYLFEIQWTFSSRKYLFYITSLFLLSSNFQKQSI